MSRLLIHIGTHKTGTTAFQQVLLQNEKLLKRKDRIGVIELNDFPRLNELKVSNIFDLSMADELKCFLHKKMITNDRFIIIMKDFRVTLTERYIAIHELLLKH